MKVVYGVLIAAGAAVIALSLGVSVTSKALPPTDASGERELARDWLNRLRSADAATFDVGTLIGGLRSMSESVIALRNEVDMMKGKACAHPLWKLAENPECGVLYKKARGAVCGVQQWLAKEDPRCPVALEEPVPRVIEGRPYASCRPSCKLRNRVLEYEYVGHGYRADGTRLGHPGGVKEVLPDGKASCECPTACLLEPVAYFECEHESFGERGPRKCRTPSNGLEKCLDDEFPARSPR